jgi:hypothetical protein
MDMDDVTLTTTLRALWLDICALPNGAARNGIVVH